MSECILYARQYPAFWNPAANKKDKSDDFKADTGRGNKHRVNLI